VELTSKGASGETFVPQSQEKTPEPGAELPNPELNPLLNPTLGRHLGRWAQVYFTSPPEKREEAVGELLRELQGQPAILHGEPAIEPQRSMIEQDQPIIKHAEPLETIRIVEAVVAEPPGLQCAACGHMHTSPQRFCGMCGAALETDPTGEGTPPMQPRSREPILTHTELAGFSPAHVHAGDDSFSDIRWLREKSLTEAQSSWRVAPRLAPAIIAVLAIGILFYAQWRPQPNPSQKGQQAAKDAPGSPQSAATKTPAEMPAPAPPPANAPLKAKASERSPESATTSQASTPPAPAAQQSPQTAPAELAPNRGPQGSATPATKEPRPAPHVTASGAAKVPPPQTAPPQTESAPNALNGAAELAMAEDFLSGRTHPRNSEVAAKYLWRAVGKENPSAILLLSNMYLVGDGVPKSCDQARLLLGAAARKGVPQAADKLRDLSRSGCPK
jgi:hypothetical protein